MDRRRFFSQLASGLLVAAAPQLFLPKLIKPAWKEVRLTPQEDPPPRGKRWFAHTPCYAIWRCSTHDAGLTEDGLCPVAGFPITGTGYFGIPGGFGGVVHATRDGKPICGQHLDPRAKYQWCCHEFDPRILECKKCERIIANHYEKAHNLLVALGPVSRSVCPSARARSGIPAAKKPK